MTDAPPLPVIDAHQHFWDLEHSRHDREHPSLRSTRLLRPTSDESVAGWPEAAARALRYPWLQDEPPPPFRYGDTRPLRRDYLPADYRRDTAGLPVIATVHIEAEHDRADPVRETDWLVALAARDGLPTACVAWARLDAPDADAVLAAQAARPMVRGIRQKPAVADDPRDAARERPGSLDDPRFRAGYALLRRHSLSFDLQAPWWELDAAAELAADFPGTTLLLNHTGLPADRSEAGLAGWRRALETLARQPNAALKISGLGLLGQPWALDANRGVIRDAVAIFGADRCLFASNFPVDGLCGTFRQVADSFLSATADRPEAERRALLAGNAARLYRLEQAVSAASSAATGSARERR